MSVPAGRRGDPVEEYVAGLDAALRGPVRAKARLLAEMRDGLGDTVTALVHDGVPYDRAVDRAVQEFGEVHELAESCQRELTVAQARHTARVVALTAPFLVACWYLVSRAEHAQDGVLPRAAQFVAVQLASVAGGAVLLAGVALAATGAFARWLPDLRRLPVAVAWTGTTASAAMAVATLTLATASVLAEEWVLTAVACALAAASHAVVAGSARACRACALKQQPARRNRRP
ncbi:permease prefix domain 1-containing protein [Streptomyces sp. NPDC048442]|uniref:permease prefix domain 1-containing protein n=1 Tax=Streptomyces sp. NPDC048442 TaxID=3154823 RepID=UPI003414A107